MKNTPIYNTHIQLGGKMVDFAGFNLPIRYSTIKGEHQAVRTKCGIFDVSHMGEFMVRGDGAEMFIHYLVTNDVKKMKIGQIIYSPMCYEDGGTIDDLLVYKKSVEDYLIVVNGSNIEKDFQWFVDHNDSEVELVNVSNDYGLIAVQGPESKAIVEQVMSVTISEMNYYEFNDGLSSAFGQVLISRTGYTGEDGYEIMAPCNAIESIFKGFIDAGVMPCGLGARDTLRFEAAMPLYGHELTKDISPKEAGLSYFIKKEDAFIGKSALEEPTKYKVVGLELLGKGIAREGYEVVDEAGNKVGHVTTGYKSPTLGRSLAMAYIQKDYGTLDQTVYVSIRGKSIEAKIVKKKFYKRSH